MGKIKVQAQSLVLVNVLAQVEASSTFQLKDSPPVPTRARQHSHFSKPVARILPQLGDGWGEPTKK